MTNEYHYSFEEWLEISDKYYHDKPPIPNKDAKLIIPKGKKSTKKKDNPHINKPIMKLF